MRNTSVILLSLAGIMSTGACRQHPPSSLKLDVEVALQALVDDTVAANQEIYGAALSVVAPTLGLDWEGGAGLADPASGAPMTAGHPVRIASNTKTYVAVAVLRLVEEGALGLDDPVAAHLADGDVAALRGDGYDPEAMTIRHLLTHTSGLYDHSDSGNYEQAIMADPSHRWTRAEQFAAAIAWGDPLGEPGEIYSYCDTGYVLLGGIIERVTGKTLAAAVRDLVGFERLGFDSTWWETVEPAPAGVPERAHQFLGELDVSDFDPSLDLYGGGGLVATVGDMSRFMRALFTDRVYDRPATLATMLTTVNGAHASNDPDQMPPGVYRMGIWVVDIDGFECYRHSGFWGTSATYVPDLDLAVACTVNQNQGKVAMQSLSDDAVAIVAQAASSG